MQNAPGTAETRKNYFYEAQRNYKPGVIIAVIGFLVFGMEPLLGLLLLAAGVGYILHQRNKTLPAITDQQMDQLVRMAVEDSRDRARDELGLSPDEVEDHLVRVFPNGGRRKLFTLNQRGQLRSDGYAFLNAFVTPRGLFLHKTSYDVVDLGAAPPAMYDYLWRQVSSVSMTDGDIRIETTGGSAGLVYDTVDQIEVQDAHFSRAAEQEITGNSHVPELDDDPAVADTQAGERGGSGRRYTSQFFNSIRQVRDAFENRFGSSSDASPGRRA